MKSLTKKRGMALMLTLVMCFSLMFGSCVSFAEESDDGKTTKELTVYGMSDAFTNIDPFNFSNVGMFHYIYEGMAQRTTYGADWEDMELICAKSITKVDDLTYDIEMYDYIYDSEGNHITADDYVWVGQAILDSGENFKISSYLDSITKLGDYEVEIHMTSAGLGNIEYLLIYIPVISQAAYEASGDGMANNPVTTAAYKVSSFAANSTLVMDKNENYWQTDESLVYSWAKQNVDEYKLEVITEPSQISIALQTGEIDMAGVVDASVLDEFYDTETETAKEGYIVKDYPSTLFTYLLYNCSEESVCSNQDFREAVSYAVDNQEILDFAAGGLGVTMTALSLDCAADYQESWYTNEYFPQDLDKAKEYLASSGFDTSTPVKILCLNADMQLKVAQVLQQELSQIGITSEITQVDEAVLNTTIADPSEWDILIHNRGVDDYSTFAWSLVFDANAYENGLTQNFIDDDELQSLLQDAMGVETHSDETVTAFEDYLEEKCYCLGLFSQMRYYVARADVVEDLYMRDYVDIIPNACTFVQ